MTQEQKEKSVDTVQETEKTQKEKIQSDGAKAYLLRRRKLIETRRRSARAYLEREKNAEEAKQLPRFPFSVTQQIWARKLKRSQEGK